MQLVQQLFFLIDIQSIPSFIGKTKRTHRKIFKRMLLKVCQLFCCFQDW